MNELIYYDLKQCSGLTHSLAGQVAREVGRRIVAGHYAPGTLIEDEIRLAERCAATLEFGETQINGVKYGIDLPPGGIKQSGIGYDCSHLALHDHLAVKRISRARTG